MLPYRVNVVSSVLHTHFLGRKLFVEQFRNGTKIRDLARNDAYDYNNPGTDVYNPPLDLMPGDRIKTTCVYDSSRKKIPTYFGQGTYDEMCYAFFSYYPKFERRRENLCQSFERYVELNTQIVLPADF